MVDGLDLGDRLEAFVSGLVSDGRYSDRTSVLRESLLLLEERERKLRTFDEAIDRGLADIEAGRVVSVEEIRAELRQRYGAPLTCMNEGPFSNESRADLIRIGDSIREYSLARAAKITDRLVDACLGLEDMPLRYPLVPRHEHRGIRRRPHDEFLIFYEVVDGTVRIVHILHGAMDYEPILFPDS